MILNILISFIDIFFIIILIGGIICVVFIIKKENNNKLSELAKSIKKLLLVSIIILMIENLVNLSVKTMSMSQTNFSDSFQFIHIVLFNTHFGTIWLLKFFALFILLMVLSFNKKAFENRITLIFTILLLIVIAFGRSAVSHSANSGDFTIPELVDLTHLLAASVWGGGLIIFSFFIISAFKEHLTDEKQFTLISKRFSFAASLSLLIIVLTAVFNSWYEIGSINSFFYTPYGRTALFKLIFLILLASIGAMNHYSSIPLFQEKSGLSKRKNFTFKFFNSIFNNKKDISFEDEVKIFSKRIKLEVIFIIIVLILTSVLVNQVPSKNLKEVQNYIQAK